MLVHGELSMKGNRSLVIQDKSTDLASLCRLIRVKTIQLAYKTKTHHISSALSCVDILVALYFGFLRIFPNDPSCARRDRFILSKGHAALAFYSTLFYRGLLPLQSLHDYCKNGSELGQHPFRNTTIGIESTCGSLGHGLSFATGCALFAKHKNSPYRTVALLGDGELNEGSVWEAAMFAAHHRLSNLIAIIDKNEIQCLGRTKDILNMFPLDKKFRSFGWSVYEIDGHDIDKISKALQQFSANAEGPTVLIALTRKGKGVSFMEDTVEWHHRRMSSSDYEKALSELNE